MIFIASGSPKPYPLYLAAILPLKKGSYKWGYLQEEYDTYIIDNFYLILVGGEYHKYFIVI
jgi:hypothetical protein